MRRDAIFYQIFQRFPNLLFELLGQAPATARGYRFESVEIKEPTFRLDGVFLPPETASPKIIFFAEVQFQKDQTLYDRFFAELHLYLYRRHGSYDDWYGVLIFPQRGLEPDNATIHRSLLEGTQVQKLYLNELPSNQAQSLGLSMMQLMLVSEAEIIPQARELITRARQEDTGYLSREEIIEVITTIAVYKLVNLSRQEVEEMLGYTLEQTRVYQEAKAEGLEAGREEGRLQMLTNIVPLLLQNGMTLEQIAQQLQVDVALVQQAIPPSPDTE